MKLMVSVFMLIFSFASVARDFTLSGTWFNASETNTKPIRFIKIGDVFHFNGQERFVHQNGTLSHTIDQTVKLKINGSQVITGTVDVFDSRGCSYKGLPVQGEIQNNNEVALLLTYPRYRVVKITVGPTNPHYRNVYCTNYYGYRYVCGRERVEPNTRTECELLENVEVPVLIKRNRF
jgi:hypothetical protein